MMEQVVRVLPFHNSRIIRSKSVGGTINKKSLYADEPVFHGVFPRILHMLILSPQIHILQHLHRLKGRGILLPVQPLQFNQLFQKRRITDKAFHICILNIGSLIGDIVRRLQNKRKRMPPAVRSGLLLYLSEDLLIGKIKSHFLVFDIAGFFVDLIRCNRIFYNRI